MKLRSGISEVQPLRFWGIRIILCALVLLIYLLLWRPARVWITEQVVEPQVSYFDEGQQSFESTLESGALLIQYEYGGGTKELQYRPEFGFFFLIALLGLFVVTNHRKPYLLLGLWHLAGSLLVYLFIMLGASGFLPGFMLADAVSGYLVPALSLGLVPLAMKGFWE